MTAYRKFVRDVFIQLIMASKSIQEKDIDVKELDARINEMIEFETKLANVSAKEEDRRDVKKIYNLFKLQDLPQLGQYPGVRFQSIQ